MFILWEGCGLCYWNASVRLKANETTQHQPAKWPSLSRRHLCANLNRFPGSWGFNPLIRHQATAQWVLNERRLSFHCPLRDHCASLLKRPATSQLLLQAHYQAHWCFLSLSSDYKSASLTFLPSHALLSIKPKHRCREQGLGVRLHFLQSGDNEDKADVLWVLLTSKQLCSKHGMWWVIRPSGIIEVSTNRQRRKFDEYSSWWIVDMM